MCVWAWMGQCFLVEIRGRFVGIGSLFHPVGPSGDQT